MSIAKGSIRIDDNVKIAKIGAKITAPEGSQVIDAGSQLVTPDTNVHYIEK